MLSDTNCCSAKLQRTLDFDSLDNPAESRHISSVAPASARPRQLDFKNGQKWRQNAGSSCLTAVAWFTSAATAAPCSDLDLGSSSSSSVSSGLPPCRLRKNLEPEYSHAEAAPPAISLRGVRALHHQHVHQYVPNLLRRGRSAALARAFGPGARARASAGIGSARAPLRQMHSRAPRPPPLAERINTSMQMCAE